MHDYGVRYALLLDSGCFGGCIVHFIWIAGFIVLGLWLVSSHGPLQGVLQR